MTTFADFRKTEHKSSKKAAEGAVTAVLAPASGPGAGSGSPLSGEALVLDYVKRQLHPHHKDKSITREQYEKIKDGWVWIRVWD